MQKTIFSTILAALLVGCAGVGPSKEMQQQYNTIVKQGANKCGAKYPKTKGFYLKRATCIETADMTAYAAAGYRWNAIPARRHEEIKKVAVLADEGKISRAEMLSQIDLILNRSDAEIALHNQDVIAARKVQSERAVAAGIAAFNAGFQQQQMINAMTAPRTYNVNVRTNCMRVGNMVSCF